MCGRYDLIAIDQALVTRFGVAPEPGEVGQGPEGWQPRYNIVPSQLNPVVVRGMNETERLLSLLRPYPDEKIRAYRLEQGMNSPGNDRVDLIRAT